ncbi:hypothetical protein EXA14_19685 [Vibrio cincinnatiensis]|nr:hypothetical protein [Vibrio cincinnatiensis]
MDLKIPLRLFWVCWLWLQIRSQSCFSGWQVNKAFKSDSQRLAFSLRSSIAKRCSHLNAALCNRREKDHNALKIKVFL